MVKFDKPMRVEGVTIPADVCQRAADALMERARGPMCTFAVAQVHAARAGVPVAQSWAFADRMLQRLRKAGAIKFTGGKWEEV